MGGEERGCLRRGEKLDKQTILKERSDCIAEEKKTGGGICREGALIKKGLIGGVGEASHLTSKEYFSQIAKEGEKRGGVYRGKENSSRGKI